MCGTRSPPVSQPLTLPADQPEALGLAELLGALEQQLHPQADPEQRRARADAFAEQLDEPELAQVAHRQRERADARHTSPSAARSVS